MPIAANEMLNAQEKLLIDQAIAEGKSPHLLSFTVLQVY
jgi:hypothetical protein